ncbi:GNAT family N-acetyltransferase [Enterococcus sp. BWM-S5]|uniref:GNAT family N-acetyltransferase n=1 Tax=Enterococcus larvae TaxID=2794352 RepID=A0ABS4CND6_9ENTE|nr:GNAT family N-acetyltransferase [Enterococcus larvae]MBP1047259.1 GNAT family N-acetyltransferase [Enterococcus larvae]
MIEYKINEPVSVGQFETIIRKTGLTRRLDDKERLEKMMTHADFLITAWEDNQIVGFARGLSDYSSVVYVADLGVDTKHWKKGIGRGLMNQIINYVGEDTHIVLLASKLAEEYYSRLGFVKDPRGYVKLPVNMHKDDWQV